MRLGAAWHAHRRFGVYRVADGGEFAQHRARIAVLEQRTMVSSPDALHQSVDVGVEPHRYSLVQNEGACLLVHERGDTHRSEEHTSELQSLMRISYAVFCLKKKNINTK